MKRRTMNRMIEEEIDRLRGELEGKIIKGEYDEIED